MNPMKVLASQIADEIQKLRELLKEAYEVEEIKLSNISIRAGSSILHDFYTGIENIFHAIASTIDERGTFGYAMAYRTP